MPPTPQFPPFFSSPVLRGLLTCLTVGVAWQPLESSAQRSGERSQERPVYSRWTTYSNPKYHYDVPVPPGMRAQSDPQKGGGCRFISDDGELVLKVWGGALAGQRGDPLEPAWREALNQRGRRIDFQRRSGAGFVLTGENADGTDFYEKVILGPGATAGANVSFPPALGPRFGPWLDEIEQGFAWHEHPRMVRGEALPPRGVLGDLRNYFTGEDEEFPPRSYTTDRVPAFPERGTRSTPEAPEPSPIPRNPDKTKVDLTPPPARSRETLAPYPLEKTSSSQGTASTQTKREDLPYGIAIPGKKGFVYSPFAENKQQVDVTDIPTGTKVKCPYTGKVFRVP